MTIGGKYGELGPIAAALGAQWSGGAELKMSRDGFTITVGLRIDSGSVMGVDLVVHRPGWPEVELRRETDKDRRAKGSGMNVEVQTGDRAFDDFVYIESSYGQAVLAPLLASPELRQLLGELVSTYGAVTFTPNDGLVVDTRAGGRAMLDPARFMPFFEKVMRVARLFPDVPKNAPKLRERGGTLMVLSGLSFLVGCGLLVALRHHGEPASGLVRPLCAAVGIVIALAIAPLVKRYVRGHSRSALYFVTTTVGLLIASPILAIVAVVGANALLDSSPPDRRSGRLVAARNYLDDSEPKVEATVQWTDGTREELTIDDTKPKAQVGDAVETVRRRGLFGITWIETPPKITPGKR